mmetsp:Transcript_33786/g.74850  ORF Transcript_33786/g.74850 Transcript_33786/m.74850 type:complete len:239 (+) Transcript_33786:1218-1934(+)
MDARSSATFLRSCLPRPRAWILMTALICSSSNSLRSRVSCASGVARVERRPPALDARCASSAGAAWCCLGGAGGSCPASMASMNERTTSKISSSPPCASTSNTRPVAASSSITGWLSSRNTCMRLRMVSSLSSARPLVSPRFTSRDTATSSGTVNTSTPSQGLMRCWNSCSWSSLRGKPSTKKRPPPAPTMAPTSSSRIRLVGTIWPARISSAAASPSSLPAATSCLSRSPVDRWFQP